MLRALQITGKVLLKYRSQLIVLITPLLLLPLPFTIPGPEAKCGYALLLLATYWCTEAIPIAATALMPVFLFPILGLMTVHDVTKEYMKNTIMMFVGGLTVAIALEKINLHKRIALAILRVLGTQPKWLMAGFMAPTWFMSMWISNTATAAMMLPMVEAVLEQIKPQHTLQLEVTAEEGEKPYIYCIIIVKQSNWFYSILGSKPSISAVISYKGCLVSKLNENRTDPHFVKLSKGFLLCVAYAANVGGVATLTGTPPNLILKGFVDDIWKAHGMSSPIDFPSWMIYGFPISVLSLVIVWYWMQLYYLGARTTCLCCKSDKGDPRVNRLIEEEYRKLGSMSYAEWVVAFMFVLLVALWFFRNPDFLNGWAYHMEDGFIGDAVPAIFIALLLFVIPSTLPGLTKDDDGNYDVTPPETLMDWETMHSKQPWGTHILIGGGFALAKACSVSGLANWIGSVLQVFDVLPGWAMVTVLSLFVSFITNVTSNSAMATLLMPIMAIMAEGIGMNPLYLMFPICVATSFAFMLPVGTPPNAIVFSSGKIKVIDMAKTGIFLNIFCVLTVTLISQTLGYYYFDFGTIPWKEVANATVTTMATSTVETVTEL
ncbi:hypothetical protein CAPTEDRAFT_180677 [Capitella teleta]|uniref:Citrate transporter-like domain-containing protein n=1 Tax=Capitella teleta TaxID=283909 RepID=R7TJB4_CAPTE|nr:hypothetical protein CAPTEDRAFT_180677 [Capitella teleta]|eukprot:ELT93587.1 hypothetical protein CAPTEDRAFT_180677 [Capitella teleta]